MPFEKISPVILARYPFLSYTRKYINEKKITLESVLHEFAFSSSREQGKKRVLESVKEGKITNKPFLSETECISEIISYVVARMIVSCINDSYLIKRYSLAESVLANDRLSKEPAENIVGVANELEIDLVLCDGDLFTVHFTDFLKYSSEFRDPKWKLTNQDIRMGRVYLDKEKCVRLLQNAIKEKFEKELPLPVTEEITNSLRPMITEVNKVLEERKKEFKTEALKGADITKLPPCMKRLLSMMEAGMNLPHTARFALTAFLHKIGMSSEEILNLFSKSPDFDPALARYQIEHITGVTSGVEYSPPECKTMKTYGNCYDEDELCKKSWMTSPFYYYKIKMKERGKRGQSSQVQKNK